MLSRGLRLTGSEEIREVVKLGLKSSNQLLTLHYIQSDNPRFAIIVSKAVGGAVQRNLLKRRARAAIFEILQDRELSIQAVLRLRPSAANASYSDFASAISTVVLRASQ